ncbi:conserved protein of unknown function [Trichlorobacter ammonificans]|uniref:Glycosyltransferase n=2 Tax=Trichlorobacter ammonificans TaxID=2916410 RepID=A0ABM9D7D1_9BACT|nr:conserved protein of unknown function [Trichlorobacter ammonificans]
MLLSRWFGRGNISNPKTFNEKIQWLKVFHRNLGYVKLADKYAVRNFVKEKIGNEFLNELIGVWDSPFELDWTALPVQFALKCTHGSGMNLLIRDKFSVDQVEINKQLSCWLLMDYSKLGREWVYKDIPRRIIAERFLTDYDGQIPKDYKIFCFNGVPRYIQVDVDRFEKHRRAFFDTSWKKQPFCLYCESYNNDLPKPKYLDVMLDAAQTLSENMPFVRVDFYAIPQVIFGEMTFFPGNGTENFYPSEWDLLLGDMLVLPQISTR